MGRLGFSLLLVAAVCSAATAAPPEPKFNVDFRIGWEGCYRPMEWTPVDIEITSNLKKAFEGDVEISAKQDELTDMTITRRIILTPDMPLRVPLAVKLAFAADECHVAIHDRHGFRRWANKYTLWERFGGSRRMTPVEDNELQIGLVGRPGFGLIHLPGRTQCTNPERTRGRVYLKRKQTRMLPWDWTGYASLDLLILYDVDYQQMRPHQAKAIAQWVSNGGKLLMVVGGRPLSPGHPVASLLPFKLGKLRQVRIPASTARGWGCEVGPTRAKDTLACWSMPGAIGRGWQVLWTGASSAGSSDAADASAPYFAHGPAGFGRVGVLACDPAALGGRQRGNLARFWAGLAGHLLGGRGIRYASSVSWDDNRWDHQQYELGAANAAANAVIEHLLSIPEMRPLSIWVVILLLVALAVLIGPVDYFVLKRIDRLPLTWLTSSACVLLFTVAAYYGVRALRAGAGQVRMVSVVDAVSGTGCAWRTIYSGIFAPASDKYELAGLRKHQWWSCVTSTRGDSLYAHAVKRATRRIFCIQGDGGNLPHAVPINIWTMQCLITEEPVEGVPFTASARREGNQMTVTIDNRSDRPIREGCVRVGENRVMEFQSVPAKSRREFSGRLHRGSDWQRLMRRGRTGQWSSTAEAACFAWGSLRRTEGIEAYLSRGAAVVCAQYGDVAEPFRLRNRNAKFDHIQMARLVVFPEEGSAP